MDAPLPERWRALLAEAAASPDGILSLTDDARDTDADEAERMTDRGLLRIVTARRYRLTEAGQAALGTRAGAAPGTGRGWWRRLFGG